MPPVAETGAIDALLERYLSLLDEYTTLRAELGRLQAGMFQHLARANFSAERGMRYGPDSYDERMQAARRVEISSPEGEGAAPVFRVTPCDELSSSGGGTAEDPLSDPPAEARSEAEDSAEPVPASSEEAKAQEDGGEAKRQGQRPRDPLRWFGVLTPMALRQTQGCAIEAVERVVPRLVSVSAAMQEVEIQVRRARKKRTKAEAAAAARGREEVVREEVAAS